MSNTPRKTAPRWTREQWIQAHESTYKFKSKTNTLKELALEEKTHFRNIITRQTTYKDLLVGFLNIHSLPSSRKGEKNLTYLIL